MYLYQYRILAGAFLYGKGILGGFQDDIVSEVGVSLKEGASSLQRNHFSLL